MNYPLEGIRVLDLSRLLPGPYCTMLLSDLGAKVIRIEQPNYEYAEFPPFYTKKGSKESIINTILMRNKESIVLNLKKEPALEVFYDLVKSADVLIETFRPGVAEKLKIDYHTLNQINPSLIYCALSGFGQTGPHSLQVAHDLNYVGLSGNIGEDKQVPHIQISDMSGSLYASIGILAALLQRKSHPEKTGQFLDISLLDSSFAFNPIAFANSLSPQNPALEIIQGEYPFYNIYKTKDDRYLTVAAIETKFWQNFCDVMEVPQYIPKQYCPKEERLQIKQDLQRIFESFSLDYWVSRFKDIEACVFPIHDYNESINDPQIKERNMVQSFNHPLFGQILQLATPIKFSDSDVKTVGKSPKKGEHQMTILKSLGYSEAKIRELEKRNCFR